VSMGVHHAGKAGWPPRASWISRARPAGMSGSTRPPRPVALTGSGAGA